MNEANKPNNTPNTKDEVTIKPLRTYEDDVKNAIYNQQVSSAQILLAEQQKKQKQEKESREEGIENSGNQKLLIFASTFLVIGLLVFVYIKFGHSIIFQEREAIVKVRHASIIYVENQKELNIDNKLRLDALAELKSLIEEPTKEGEITEIVITTKNEDSENILGGDKKIKTEEFFTLLGLHTSNRAIRSLGDEIMIGVYGNKESQPFIIAEVDDYQSAYAGMLDWEILLTSNFKYIFSNSLGEKIFEKKKVDEATGTTTVESVATTTEEFSTTTPQTATTTTEAPKKVVDRRLNYEPNSFKDIFINNYDTRAVVDFNGEVIFFYSFYKEDYLIIATDRDAFKEIIRSIQSKSLAQ